MTRIDITIELSDIADSLSLLADPRVTVNTQEQLRRTPTRTAPTTGVSGLESATPARVPERSEPAGSGLPLTRVDLERHIETICRAAGLNTMVDVFDIVLARDLLEGDIVSLLGPTDVQALYDRYVEPAVDRVESALVALSLGVETWRG